MKSKMTLRSLTIDDAGLLLSWRNDPSSLLASGDRNCVLPDNHTKWLVKALKNSSMKLIVAEIDRVPVGSVRLEMISGFCFVSWTIASELRGKGYGKRMIELAVKDIKKPLKAKIRTTNIASSKIAEAIGLKPYRLCGEIMVYHRLEIVSEAPIQEEKV